MNAGESSARPLRVAIVSLANGPSMQRYAAFLSEEISSRHLVHVFCSVYADRALFQRAVAVTASVPTRSPRIEKQTFNVAALLRLVHSIRRFRPDVVHFTSTHPWNLVVAVAMSRIPLVFTIHDVVPHPNEGVSTLVKMYNWATFNHLATRVILHGRAYLPWLNERGVDLNKIDFAPLGEYERHEEPPAMPRQFTVLFFGRIRPYKGLDVLASAVEILRMRGSGAKVVVIGDGDLGPLATQLSNAGVMVRNEFVPESAAGRFFDDASVVVLPYRSATQSGVIPVSYAHGRPVVATSVGALPEMVDETTGVLIPPEDPVALADALELLATHPERCMALGAQARRRFMEEFTPHAMAEQIERTYYSATGLPPSQ